MVEFTNNVDFATTLRWHGVRVENRYDGVPGLTQRPVRVGSTYTAHVRFPDAGVFWYHPHQRGHIAQDLGLYGSIIVDSPDPDYYGPANSEESLIIDDALMTETGWTPFGSRRRPTPSWGGSATSSWSTGDPDSGRPSRKATSCGSS